VAVGTMRKKKKSFDNWKRNGANLPELAGVVPRGWSVFPRTCRGGVLSGELVWGEARVVAGLGQGQGLERDVF